MGSFCLLILVQQQLQRIQVECLMTSVIAFVITVDWLRCEACKLSDIARWGWYHSVWEKARCLIDLRVMAIEIKIQYSYYSTKRITPVYIVKEELMSLEYSKFVERIVNEVPHLRRMNSLRLTVTEDETVDEVNFRNCSRWNVQLICNIHKSTGKYHFVIGSPPPSMILSMMILS